MYTSPLLKWKKLNWSKRLLSFSAIDLSSIKKGGRILPRLYVLFLKDIAKNGIK